MMKKLTDKIKSEINKDQDNQYLALTPGLIRSDLSQLLADCLGASNVLVVHNPAISEDNERTIIKGTGKILGISNLPVEIKLTGNQNNPDIEVNACLLQEDSCPMPGFEWLTWHDFCLDLRIKGQELTATGKISGEIGKPHLKLTGDLTEISGNNDKTRSVKWVLGCEDPGLKDISLDRLIPGTGSNDEIDALAGEIADLRNNKIKGIRLIMNGWQEHTLEFIMGISWPVLPGMTIHDLTILLKTYPTRRYLLNAVGVKLYGKIVFGSSGPISFVTVITRDYPGIQFDFTIRSEPGTPVTVGDICESFMAGHFDELIPAGNFTQKLKESFLTEIQISTNPRIGELSFKAEGNVLGISGQVRFKIIPTKDRPMIFFQLYCTNEPVSIPDILEDTLGIPVDEAIESYLPQMRLALRELSFDQLNKSFRLAGVIARESYEMRADLDLQWSEGIRIDMSLDADDDKAPTLTALAENLPFSLEEIKQVIPENIVEKIGATAFYRLNISIDTAEKSLSIEGVAKLFGELLVSISLNVSQVGGKPSLRFSTYVSVDDPLFLDDLLKLLGVDTAGEMIPHIALNLEEIDFDQEQKHFFIKSSIQSSTGKSELALDINFEAGLTLDFSAHSEKDAYVSLGDIAGPFLTKELNTLTTQGFLPAKINKNLQNSGLLDLQFNLDTAAKSLSFYAEGTVLGMSGQVWFSILPFMGQSMASFQIYCTNKPTSIPGIMKNMLGITIDKTIESYLPKMQLALRELSFDQLDKSFRLAGVIAQESYEVQAGLDIQWSEGVRVDLSLEADEEKPPTLTALAENLPFSLAGIKQVIPGKIVEKIGATAFYGLTVNIDTAEKSFSIEGAAKLFGELLVIASLRYFEEDDHRYLALNASIHEEPVSIREFPGLIGLAGPDEKPGWLDIIPDFKMDIEEFNFDQQEKYFSLNGMIGFDDRKAVTEFRLEKIAKGVIIHIGFEADPEKPPSLISLLGAVIPGISASDIHLPGNMDIMLRTLDLSLDTANKNLGGIALGEIIITGVPVFLSAESKGPDVPWTFKVHSQPTKAISLTGLITNILNISKIELPMKLADVVISNIDLSITPASGEFKFAGQSSMAVPVAAAGTTLNTTLGIDIKRESSKAKPRGKLNGTLKYKEINFTLDLELAEKATLTASAKNLNLSEIAEKLTGTKLPGEVPDLVIKELTLEITSQKELHIYGKVELKQTSTGKKVMEVGTTKFPLGSLEFDFTRTKTKTTCSIAVKGENVILTGDIKFNEFSFSFNYHQTQGWKLAGNVKTTILEQTFELGASYEVEKETKKKTVALSYQKTTLKPLLEIPGIGAVDVKQVKLTMERHVQETAWSFTANGMLRIDNLCKFSGTLALQHDPRETIFSFTPEGAIVTIPLFPLPDGDKFTFEFEFGAIVISRKKIDGKTLWGFEASASFACPQFYKILPAEIQSIFPEKITTTFVARGSAVSIITREILDARVNIPPIKLEGGVEIPLGLTRFSLTNFALNIGKELSLSLDFGLGLPASLNKNFGTNEKDEPFLNIFNTFDPVNPEETTIRLRLAVGTKGVKLVLATSPFAFITFKEKDGKVWCYADFGECGAVRFQVPEFSLDLKTRSFVFNGGFEVVRDLALPLHLVKMLLKGMKAEGVADILPDKVPLQEISILNKQDKLEIDKIIKLVEDILHIDIPAEFEAVLEIMAEGVNRLPDDLRKYLKITLPKSFNFDISVTPENQGLSIKAGVKKGDPPIRMLIPSLGAFYLPELIGLEFYSFSLGEIFATNFLLLELNLRIDHFDLLTLSAALALGTDHGLPLPSSNEIQRHYIIEDLFMLIITAIKVYGIPIPIPIPLFYKELGFEYYGFEGVKAQGHIGFPKPELNIAGLVKAVKDFVLFVIKPEARMDPKALGKMDLKFHIGANYIQLPKYLGRKSIGTKKGIPLPGAYETMATLLNAIKFLSINELIKAIPYKYRVGSAAISLGPLSSDVQWLLTTPKEFLEGAYAKLDIPGEKTSEYMSILPTIAAPTAIQETKASQEEEGIVLFLRGAFGLKNVINGEAVFGLAASGSMGFHTGFKVSGDMLNLLEMEMAGWVSINTQKALAAAGKLEIEPPITPVEFNGEDAFVTLPGLEADFSQGITIELWVFCEEFRAGAVILDMGNGETGDNITLKQGDKQEELTLVIFQESQEHLIQVSNILPAAKWVNLALSIDRGGKLVLYKDGPVLANGDLRIPLPPSIERRNNFIGRGIGNAPLFKGKITDFRLWNKVLNAETIKGRKDRRLIGSEAGLVGCWPRGEGVDGQTWEIIWRSTTRVKGPEWPAAKRRRTRRKKFSGLCFDGDNDYVSVADPFPYDRGFTIALWLKPVRIDDGQWHGIIGKQGETFRKPSLWLGPRDGALHYDSYSPDGQQFQGELKNFFLQADKWVHLAWVKEGTEYRFYRNGKLFAASPAPVHYYTNRNRYWIGKVDNCWCGLIDEVRIWERVLSAAEIKSSLNHHLTGFEPGLVGYWPFGEGAGKATLDVARNVTSPVRGASWAAQQPLEMAGLHFNGKDAFVALPLDDAFDLTDSLTIEAWILLSDPPTAPTSQTTRGSGWIEEGGSDGWLVVADKKNWIEVGGDAGWINTDASAGWVSIAAVKNPWTEPAAGLAATSVPKDLYRTIICRQIKNDTGNQGLNNFFFALKNNRLYFAWRNNAQADREYLSATGSCIIGKSKKRTWTHVAVVKQPNRLLLYIDGEPEIINNDRFRTDTGLPGTTGFSIGSQDGKQHFFQGRIDELRIWEKACSEPEIKARMQQRLGGDEPDLLAYWPFSEGCEKKTLDMAGNRHGLLYETLWCHSSHFERLGLRFDGRDDYVDLGKDLRIGKYFTLEAWVRGTGGTIFQRDGDNTARGHLELDFNNWFRFVDTRGTLQALKYRGLPHSQWAHIAATYDGKLMKIYIDGEEVASRPAETRLAASTAPAAVGKRLNDAQKSKFKGVIDDVRVWNYARSPQQIKCSRYQRLTGNEPGLVNYWPFIAGSGLTVFDYAGRNNGKLVGAGWAKARQLKLSGHRFDGKTTFLEVPDPFTRGEEFTISLWLNPERIDTGSYHGIIGKEGTAAEPRKPGLWLGPNNGALFYDSYSASGRKRCSGCLENFFLAAGQWVHLAWVKKGTTYIFYRNGYQFAEAEAPEACYSSESSYFIGKVDNHWLGLIDEVRIWDHARLEEDIQADLIYRLSEDAAGLVGYWPLGEEARQIAGDLTAKQKVSGIHGFDAIDSQHFQLNGLEFDGEQDYLDLGTGLPVEEFFTIEAWVKGSEGTIIQRDGDHHAKGHFQLDFNRWFQFVNQTGTRHAFTYEGLPVNEWAHVAATYDGREMKVLVNGLVVKSQAANLVVGPGSARARTIIGKRLNDREGFKFKGCIDEVRTWNRARSPGEIQADMRRRLAGSEPGLIGYWPFREGIGQTAFDRAGRNNGKLYGPRWKQSAQVEMEGLAFDGDGDYIDCSNILSPYDQPWSVELWFQWQGQGGTQVLYSKANLFKAAVRGGCFQYAWQPHFSWSGEESFPVQPGRWYHAAVVYDGVRQVVYKDGEQVFVRQQNGSMGNNTAPFLIGAEANPAPTSFFKGQVHSVRIWNRARSETEILAECYTHLTGLEPGLVGCWQLQPGSDTPFLDLAGRQRAYRHGTGAAHTGARTEQAIERILSGEEMLDIDEAGSTFVIAGHSHLKLLDKNVFSGDVLIKDDLFAFRGELDIFPVESPLQVKGGLRGVITPNKFLFKGDMDVKLLSLTLVGGQVLFSHRGFWLKGTLLDQRISLILEKEQENRIVFTGSLDKPLVLGNIFKLAAGKTGKAAKTGPKLKIAGPDNPEFMFQGYIEVLGISQETTICIKADGFLAILKGSLWGKFNTKLTLYGRDLQKLSEIGFSAEFENGLAELVKAIKDYLNAVFDRANQAVDYANAEIERAKKRLEDEYQAQKKYWENEAKKRKAAVEKQIEQVQKRIDGWKKEGDKWLAEAKNIEGQLGNKSREFSGKLSRARRDINIAQQKVNSLLREIHNTQRWYNSLPAWDLRFWITTRANQWIWVGPKIAGLWAAHKIASLALQAAKEFLRGIDALQKKAVEGLKIALQEAGKMKKSIDASIDRGFEEIKKINDSLPAWVHAPELAIVEVEHSLGKIGLDLAQGFLTVAQGIVKGIQDLANACLNVVGEFPVQIKYAKFSGQLGTSTARKFAVLMDVSFYDLTAKGFIDKQMTFEVDFDDLPGTAFRLVSQLMPAIVMNDEKIPAEKKKYEADWQAAQLRPSDSV